MIDSIRIDKEREAERKAERKARGSRVYAVLPWRGDGRYDGADVIKWFRYESAADEFAEGINGGSGVAVRDYTMIHNNNAEPREMSRDQVDKIVAEAAMRYR